MKNVPNTNILRRLALEMHVSLNFFFLSSKLATPFHLEVMPIFLPLPTAFVIKHFSDTVQYQSYGFLEKNRDTISKELVNVMRESNLTICRTLMSLNENTADRSGKETAMDGRVKINAAKQLVNETFSVIFV